MMMGLAMVFVSCSQQESATSVVSKPVAESSTVTTPKPKTKPRNKTTATSSYTYSGPRMPGLKVSRVSVPGNYVALTFDDGPSHSLTPRVLDILKRYDAKATFFVVGRSVGNAQNILARAVAEGHEIGAHTWSHIKMSASSSERIISEMDRTNAAIKNVTGIAPRVMRPPYGAVNANIVSLMKSRYGMSTIMWDVDTRDWQHPGVSVVTNRAVGMAKPGSIILLHDIHASTLQAVEGIVSGLQARGFRLVTVSQLLALNSYAVRKAATQVSAQPAEAAAATPAAESAVQPAAESAPAEAQPAAPAPAAATAEQVGTMPTQEAPTANTLPAADGAGAASISGGSNQ